MQNQRLLIYKIELLVICFFIIITINSFLFVFVFKIIFCQQTAKQIEMMSLILALMHLNSKQNDLFLLFIKFTSFMNSAIKTKAMPQQCEYIFYSEPSEPDTLIMLSSYQSASTIFSPKNVLIINYSNTNQQQVNKIGECLKKSYVQQLEIQYQFENVNKIVQICSKYISNNVEVFLFYTGIDIKHLQQKLSHLPNQKLTILDREEIIRLIDYKLVNKVEDNQNNWKQESKQKSIAYVLQQHIQNIKSCKKVKLYHQNSFQFKVLKAMKNQKFNYKLSIQHFYNLVKKIKWVSEEKIDDFYHRNKQVFLSGTRALGQYTNDIFVFPLVNILLRSSSSPTELYYILPIYQALSQKISDLNIKQQRNFKQPLKVYRGCFLTNEEIAFFKNNIDYYIHMPGFLSTSCSKKLVENNFAVNGLIQIQIDSQSDFNFGFANVSDQSHFYYEQEILFDCLNVFKIISCQVDENYFSIKLVYVAKQVQVQHKTEKKHELTNQNIDITCQGDLLYMMKDQSLTALNVAYLYWKKYMSILYDLHIFDIKLIYKQIKALEILLQLQIKMKNFSQAREEICLFNKRLSQFHFYKIQIRQQYQSDKDLTESFFKQIQKVKKKITEPDLQMIRKQLLKLNKKYADEFETQMKNYFSKSSNLFLNFEIQDSRQQISIPHQFQSLVTLKNPQLMKYELDRAFLYNNIACLNHKIYQIENYFQDIDLSDRVVEVPSLQELVQRFKFNKFQIITCIDNKTFVEIMQSKILLEPGEFTVIFFLNHEQVEKRKRQKMKINDVVTINYQEKQIIIVTGTNFKMNVLQPPLRSFLLPPTVQNQFYSQNSLHYYLLFSLALKQKTQLMKSFQSLTKLILNILLKENQENRFQLETVFQKIRKNKYQFKQLKLIQLLTQKKDLQKCLQMLKIRESSGILLYFEYFIKEINLEIISIAQKGRLKNQPFTVENYTQLSMEQIQAFKQSKGQFIQNKNLLVCSMSQCSSTFPSRNVMIQIKINPKKTKKKLFGIGDYCFSSQYHCNFFEDDRKVFFNFLCTFEILKVKQEKFRTVIMLNYVEADDFYCLPNDEEQPIFIIKSIYETTLSYRIEQTLHHARARQIKTQGQVYANLIPDEGYKNVQKDEKNYLQHRYNLCWNQYKDQNNFYSLFKKASELINSINCLLEMWLKMNEQVTQTIIIVRIFEEKINLQSWISSIFKYTQNGFNQREEKLQLLKRISEYMILKIKIKQKSMKLNLDQKQCEFIMKNVPNFIHCMKEIIKGSSYQQFYQLQNNLLEKEFKLTALRFLRDWVLINEIKQVNKQPIDTFVDLYIFTQKFQFQLPIEESFYPNVFKNKQQEIDNNNNEPSKNFHTDHGHDDNLSTNASNILETNNYIKYDFLRQTIEIVHINMMASLMKLIRFLFNVEHFKKQLNQAKMMFQRQKYQEYIQLEDTDNQAFSEVIHLDPSQAQQSSKLQNETQPSDQVENGDDESEAKDFRKKQKQQYFVLNKRQISNLTKIQKIYQQTYRQVILIWSFLNESFHDLFKVQRKLEFTKEIDVENLSYKDRHSFPTYLSEISNILERLEKSFDTCYEKSMTDYLFSIKKQIKDRNGGNYQEKEMKKFEIQEFLSYLQEEKQKYYEEELELVVKNYIAQKNFQIKVNSINKMIKQQNSKWMKLYSRIQKNYFQPFNIKQQQQSFKDRRKLFYISIHLSKMKNKWEQIINLQKSQIGSIPQKLRQSIDTICQYMFIFRSFIREQEKQ